MAHGEGGSHGSREQVPVEIHPRPVSYVEWLGRFTEIILDQFVLFFMERKRNYLTHVFGMLRWIFKVKLTPVCLCICFVVCLFIYF